MSYRKKHIKPKIKSLKKRKRFFQFTFFWIALLFIVIAFTIFYAILFLPLFQVTKIEISGNKTVESSKIEQVAWKMISKKIISTGFLSIDSRSIFMVSSENLIKDILNSFPAIESVEEQKKLPQSIILTIKERIPFAVFCNSMGAEECFLMDENGIIFEAIDNIPNGMIIIKTQSEMKELILGQKIIEKDIIDDVAKVQKDIKDNFQITINKVTVSNPLIFETSESWRIYFDPDSDIGLQLTKMNIILKDQISQDERKKLQYIYLQYKDRAYYK